MVSFVFAMDEESVHLLFQKWEKSALHSLLLFLEKICTVVKKTKQTIIRTSWKKLAGISVIPHFDEGWVSGSRVGYMVMRNWKSIDFKVREIGVWI